MTEWNKLHDFPFQELVHLLLKKIGNHQKLKLWFFLIKGQRDTEMGKTVLTVICSIFVAWYT